MPAQDLVIGLDISTTACKAVVVDACGNLLGSGRAPLPMLNPRSGWYEQTADSWWHAVCEALREAARQIDPARVAGLCIAAPRETFVITDVDGQPLADALLWMDQRSRTLLAAADPTVRFGAGSSRT